MAAEGCYELRKEAPLGLLFGYHLGHAQGTRDGGLGGTASRAACCTVASDILGGANLASLAVISLGGTTFHDRRAARPRLRWLEAPPSASWALVGLTPAKDVASIACTDRLDA